MPDDRERTPEEAYRAGRHEVESWIEACTDPLSIALGALVNPVGTALRATIGLPVAIETHFCLGVHIEMYIAPAPAPPFPAPALFLGIADLSLVGIALDLAAWALGASPVPVTGEYVGMFKALRAGDSASGFHFALLPPPIVLKPTAALDGEMDMFMGSDSVDADGNHIVRFLEMGMGCNETPIEISAPNTLLIWPIQYTSPVLAGGNSVLDVGAAIDSLGPALVIIELVLAALGGPHGPSVTALTDLAGMVAETFGDELGGAASPDDDLVEATPDGSSERPGSSQTGSGSTASIDPRAARSQGGGEASVA